MSEKAQGPARSAVSGVVVTELAALPGEALLDEAALASVLGVTKRTVRRMVARYELPPPVRFAGRSTWQPGRVLEWYRRRADVEARAADRARRSRATSSPGR